MPLVQSKQVNKLIAGRIYVAGYAFTAGAGVSSFNATATLTTAVATAGDGAKPVPLQSFIALTQPGLVTTAGANQVEIYDSATKLKISSGGNEVYGRLTLAAGVYTVNLFTMVAGTETAYVPAANITIDYVPQYVYTFELLPANFATGLKSSYVNDDPDSVPARTMKELVTVTGSNALNPLSQPYTVGPAELWVNGQVMSSLDGSFTISGTTVSWVPAVAGYNLATTDVVIAVYPY